MPNLSELMVEYQSSHENPINQKVHKICVPIIEWSLLGMLWTLPAIPIFGGVHGSTVLIVLAFVYYLTFRNWKVILLSALGLIPFFLSTLFPVVAQFSVYLTLFVVAWLGQFYGHHVEGKKPSFLKDIFFLLIGPLWVGERVLNKFGATLLK